MKSYKDRLSLTSHNLLARTYICAAKLATWGVAPDFKQRRIKSYKDQEHSLTVEKVPHFVIPSLITDEQPGECLGTGPLYNHRT